MIRVRPVEPADAAAWAAMRHALWPDESAEELAAEVDAFFRGTARLLEAVLVAVDPEAGPVGFAELARRAYAEGCTTSPVGFLEGWYVAPAHRGRGVGRALVAAAEGWARGQGCREFASDTQLDNTASAAAHRALGFEEVEVVRCFRKALDVESACPFCRIAARTLDAVVLYEDAELIAFLDLAPIRPGHTQVVPKAHIPTFELLPPALGARLLALGQRLARRMKEVYQVERVAFLFTGGDVAHVHAHVVPMHAKTDITSARYLVEPPAPRWSSAHLRVERAELERVRAQLAFTPDEG